jgi:hypothetical protein
MTQNTPRIAVSRPLTVLIPAVLVAAIAIGFVGATRATGASAAEKAARAVVQADPACLTDDLSGTLIGQTRDRQSGVRTAMLRLTNTSGRTCRVQGWADLAMVTPPGELVQVPIRKIDEAGGDAEIILTPEASAWSRVQWDTCEAGHEGCAAGVALQYIVDPESTGTVADLTAVPEADRAGITMRAMRVGPLRATER